MNPERCLSYWEAMPVDKVERLHLEWMWLQVASDAIQRRHPHAQWIADHSRGLPVPMKDDTLLAAVERIGVWLAEQPPIPIAPDSELARRARLHERAAAEG